MPEQPEPLDPTDDAPQHSPLEREITRDGTTVRVCIYRGPQDPGWLLEIEDERGGSTVWEDPFDSDQAALDEALQTIEEEGIHSLTVQHGDPDSMRALWKVTTSEPAIAELKRTLDSSRGTRGFHHACGVLAAVTSTPELQRPSEWFNLIKADHIFQSEADLQRFMAGLMALYEEVLRSVTTLDAHCCPSPDDHDAVRDFCAGYVRLVTSDPTVSQDPQVVPKLLPIYALAGLAPLEEVRALAHATDEDLEHWLQRAREQLWQTVTSLHAHWEEARQAAAERHRQRAQPQRRATPKVGRNDRCPCGSGKKFKKCCAP